MHLQMHHLYTVHIRHTVDHLSTVRLQPRIQMPRRGLYRQYHTQRKMRQLQQRTWPTSVRGYQRHSVHKSQRMRHMGRHHILSRRTHHTMRTMLGRQHEMHKKPLLVRMRMGTPLSKHSHEMHRLRRTALWKQFHKMRWTQPKKSQHHHRHSQKGMQKLKIETKNRN